MQVGYTRRCSIQDYSSGLTHYQTYFDCQVMQETSTRHKHPVTAVRQRFASASHMQTLKQTHGTATRRSHSLLKGPKADQKGKSGKLTSTKNKIRGVQRLLRKVRIASSSAVRGRLWCKLQLDLQAGIDNKLRRSLDAKLLELQDSLDKHNKEELERKFAVRYHKVSTSCTMLCSLSVRYQKGQYTQRCTKPVLSAASEAMAHILCCRSASLNV